MVINCAGVAVARRASNSHLKSEKFEIHFELSLFCKMGCFAFNHKFTTY